jgi:AraC-like DNA-binding protein
MPTVIPKRPTLKFDFGRARNAEAARVPVSAMADSLSSGTFIPPHSHARGQLIYAVTGTMEVLASGALWTLPPSHALWVPPRVVHEISMSGPVELRTLYVTPRHSIRVGTSCRVVFVSPLLRELIARTMELPQDYAPASMQARIMRLILEELRQLPNRPLCLRMPTDPRLARLCRILLQDLCADTPIAKLGAAVGLSARSVIRLFQKQTGLSFRSWQNQARLLKAFELFDQGRSVTRVAVEVGYSSPAAFAKMFRRIMGKAPTEMIVRNAVT